MTGLIFVHRSIFRHDLFAGQKYGRRDAWLWLISEAAWKPRRVRVKSGNATEMLDLERGELTHSERFMADVWGWSRKAVRTFISQLQQEEMISLNQDHLQSIITICNYDEYQLTPRDLEPTQAQHGPNTGPKKNTLEEDSRVEGSDDALRQEAWRVVEKLQPILGIDPDFPAPEWLGAWGRVEMGLRTGWNAKTIIESVTAQASRKGSDPPRLFKYYEKGIARAHAEQAAPIPQAEIIPLQTVEARRHARIPNLVDTAKEMRAEFRRVRAETGLRDRPDGADVRMLPQGRGERPEDVHGGGGQDAG